jgi:hypothetical protein
MTKKPHVDGSSGSFRRSIMLRQIVEQTRGPIRTDVGVARARSFEL